MKCILIADNANFSGGISSVLISQAEGLKRAGVKTWVFAAFGPPAPLLQKNVEEVKCLHPVQGARSKIDEIWNFDAARQLEQYLRLFDPRDTIIHVHSLSLGLSPAIGPVLRRSGFAYVATAHDPGWTCPTGYSYNFQTRRYCKLVPFSAPCLACNCDKKTYIHKVFKLAKVGALDYLSGFKSGAFCFLTPSVLLRDRLRPRVPAHVPVEVLLNAVNCVDNGPKTEIGGRFLFVGRLWEEKGIVELLQAIGDSLPLDIIGDGQLRGELEKRYPRVRFKGWLDASETLKEMRKARAVIVPSIYMDTAPLVLTEALSQGTPVIGSNRAGNSGLIENGKNGFVVDMGEGADLRAACDKLMDDDVVGAMSAQAYRLYWDNPLTLERHMAGLMPVLEKALASKR